jgi:DnaJ-class molecular chaperone
MICPECVGNGNIRIPGTPDVWETSQGPFANEAEINCPTCEGDGELADTPYTKHCNACGETIAEDRDWCDEHKDAALVGEGLGLKERNEGGYDQKS